MDLDGDDIIISKEGFIIKGKKRLSIGLSDKNDLLWIGVQKGIEGHTGSVNPQLIRIREKKGMFSPKIEFDACMDFDVIATIILQFT